jgi:hypothetical protein
MYDLDRMLEPGFPKRAESQRRIILRLATAFDVIVYVMPVYLIGLPQFAEQMHACARSIMTYLSMLVGGQRAELFQHLRGIYAERLLSCDAAHSDSQSALTTEFPHQKSSLEVIALFHKNILPPTCCPCPLAIEVGGPSLSNAVQHGLIMILFLGAKQRQQIWNSDDALEVVEEFCGDDKVTSLDSLRANFESQASI